MFDLLRRLAPCAVVLAAALTSPARAEEAPPATLSLDQIIAGMKTIDDAFNPAINSFFIHYIQEQHTMTAAGQPTPGEDRWIDVDNARKGALAYTRIKRKSLQHKTPYEEWYVWRDNITQQRLSEIVNIFGHLIPQNYTFFRYTDGFSANAMRLLEFNNKGEEAYAGGVKGPGVDPSRMFQPETLAENKGLFRVRPRLEKVEGTWCHVVEWPGGSTLWIDQDHGFLIVKQTQENDGLKYSTRLNKDLFEARPGLWLPRSEEVWIYADPKEKGGPQAVERKDFLKLVKIEFNTLDDSFFKLPIKDEEQVTITDSVRKVQYFKHPKGTDPVEAAVRGIRPQMELNYTRTWLLVNGLIVGVIGFLFLYLQIKKAAAK